MNLVQYDVSDQRATKRKINYHKLERVHNDPRTLYVNFYCHTKDQQIISGMGLYLDGCVYIILSTGAYKYRVVNAGVNKDNLAFQQIGFVSPF